MKKFPIATQEIGSIRKPKWLVKLLQNKDISEEIIAKEIDTELKKLNLI